MWFLVLIMKLNSRVFWDFWLCFEDCLVFVKKKMGKRRMIWFWFCFRRAEWLMFWCFNLRGDMVVTSDL